LIFIVVWLPVRGKSFFARQFSETFSAPEVNYDRLRHALYAEPSFTKSELDLVEKLANYEIDELLKTQKTFIIDGGGWTKAQRLALRKKAQEAGFGTLIVWVQTDENTVKYRSMKRSKKRKDDQYNVSLSASQYEQLAKRFSAPVANEPSVVISGKHTYATQARVVLKKLVAPRVADTKTIVNHANRAPDASQPRRNVIIR
ncbi:MAG: AAA family ATPase, partial [Candidatus Saccharibacteria bacterium]|nr:AAA family ATPase [Candidatus Saccharibacteria bacterium]